jgi:hypothetical protein
MVKVYGEFLREATTLWAISGISGTGTPTSQDIKYGHTCRRGERLSWQIVGALMPTGSALGTMCRRYPEAVGGLSSVIKCGLAAEADRHLLSARGGRYAWGTRELARPLDRAGSLPQSQSMPDRLQLGEAIELSADQGGASHVTQQLPYANTPQLLITGHITERGTGQIWTTIINRIASIRTALSPTLLSATARHDTLETISAHPNYCRHLAKGRGLAG